MQYKRVKARKIYEEVTDSLTELIRSGQLKPGDKLESVERLALNFQVGRSAIREALTALRAMGLIEIRHGEGTFVRNFDANMLTIPTYTSLLMKKEHISQLLEVRKILEVGAVKSAAIQRDEMSLKEITSALDEMRNARNEDHLGQADHRFHTAIAKATKNDVLVNLMDNISEMVANTMKDTRRLWLSLNEGSIDLLYYEHKDILRAIEKQDGDQAQQLMLKHLEQVEKVLKQLKS